MIEATRPAPAPSRANTNGQSRREITIPVKRSELVYTLMDAQALAEQAVYANGASLQTVMRLPAGAWRDALQQAHHDTHGRLVALLKELRMATNRYESTRQNGT